MERGMDDECGAVDDEDGDDGSDTEADDDDFGDFIFEENGIKYARLLDFGRDACANYPLKKYMLHFY